jgi:hypothetical protein
MRRGMRMNRAVVLATTVGLAVVLALGLVSVPAQGKVKKVKVETEIDWEGSDDSNFPDSIDQFGRVEAAKAKCVRNRSIQVERLDTNQIAASDVSDDAGAWEVTIDLSPFPDEGIQATAERRTYKKKRRGKVVRKIVCKQDVSPPLFYVVPGP